MSADLSDIDDPWGDAFDEPEEKISAQESKRLSFRREYEHFTGFGWTDEQIAMRLGFNNLESFRRRVQRNGLSRAQTNAERQFDLTFATLLARGGTFTALAFPDLVDERLLQSRLASAARAGIIRSLGRAPGSTSTSATLWEVVEISHTERVDHAC